MFYLIQLFQMRFIKLGIISLATLFLLITVIGSLLPSNVIVSRTIDINTTSLNVYYFVADMKNWCKWMSGVNENSFKVLSYNKGKIIKARIGSNEVSIINETQDSVSTLWKGKNNRQQLSNFTIIQNKPLKVTTVNWIFQEHVQWYPWQKISTIMNDKILGPEMEKSLEKLKNISEVATNN